MNDTINYLKTIREVTYSQGGVDCLTKAIEACEKQVAVKVDEEWEEMSDDYVMVTIKCPTCGCVLTTSDPPEEKRGRCDECGQKLDWED